MSTTLEAADPETDLSVPAAVTRGEPMIPPLAALVASQLITGGTYLMVKIALREFDPVTLGMWRFGIAGLIYAIVLAGIGQLRLPSGPDRRKILLAAFFAVPLNQGLFLFGMQYTLAAHGAVLYATTPIFVLLFSAMAGGERPTALRIGGIALSLFGVVVVLTHRGFDVNGGSLFGDGLVFLAVLIWALYTLLTKDLVRRSSALTVTGQALAYGALLSLPLGLPLMNWNAVSQASNTGIGAMLYLAILTSVLAYFVFGWALTHLDASRVAVVSNLQPVVAALLAWQFLGEPIGWGFWAGTALVAIGVGLTQRH